MKRAILSLICLLSAGCGDDPARSVKIISQPPVPMVTAFLPPRGPDRNSLPEFCPPAEDSPGPGSFFAKGPCEFRQSSPARCQASTDDFIVAIPRKAKNGGSLVVYLNVEQYHGPGSYDKAQLFVAVQGETTLYRWSNEDVHATVGPGEAFVTLPKTRLEQEPMRIQCSRLIGPASNYQYQCAASSVSNLEFDSSAEVVQGKLQCATSPTKPLREN
jgi:hypothetical protein